MKKSKIVFIIVPLFIGAFFLPIFFRLAFFVFFIFLVLFFKPKSFYSFIKVSFALFLSIIPFIFSIVFTHKVGKVFHFLFLTFYSEGLLKASEYTLNVMLINLFSFYIVKILKISEGKLFNKFPFIFLTFEFYSEMAEDFIFNTGKISKIIHYIEEKYKTFKKINHQSNGS